jgi:hypothetical protein
MRNAMDTINGTQEHTGSVKDANRMQEHTGSVKDAK